MKLENLKKQVTKNSKRVGRGISAGQGKTAGRGTKGQKSRTGGNIRPGFEGGQMPLVQRVPKKRGFTSRRPKAQTVKLEWLSFFKDGEKVTVESLYKAKLVKSPKLPAKIVGEKAEIKKLTVLVPASGKAAKAIEKAGGKMEVAVKAAKASESKEAKE